MQWGTSLSIGVATVSGYHFFLLGLLGQVISMPFSVYDTFVVEQKHGFNRTTCGTYVKDFVKGLKKKGQWRVEVY